MLFPTLQPEKDILELILGVLQIVLRNIRGDSQAHAHLAAIDVIVGDLLHPRNHIRFRKAGVRLNVSVGCVHSCFFPASVVFECHYEAGKDGVASR